MSCPCVLAQAGPFNWASKKTSCSRKFELYEYALKTAEMEHLGCKFSGLGTLPPRQALRGVPRFY